MRLLSFVALSFLTIQVGLGQTASNEATASSAEPGLPKGTRELFAAAAPFYNFSDPSLKPWHLKASYQLFDEKGNPTEQGSFEYWWASPQIYRSTWTRGTATQTDWHTGDGKHGYQRTGEPLKYFEFKLRSALLSPLPDDNDLDSAKNTLDRQTISLEGIKLECAMVSPIMVHPGLIARVQMGLFPTYCFDQKLPVMRISYSLGGVIAEYDHIVKMQNRFLARGVVFYQGKQKILSATVDSLTALSPTDAVLTPPPDVPVSDQKPVNLVGGITQGLLLNKQAPVYPQDAKDNRVAGTVVLQATIGRDGGIHDLHVVSAPWPSLAASALWSVSHWQYKPYLLNGEPVEVETTVNVVYSLGN